ncbi:DUF305 domain-containing protein [Micromonospora zingiberis]|uniref:DUF305 domain-containing protein n=1 Tax=Micromonospora zingiberis TaxID=2053011 RepID=UPI0013F3E603|nr:DUF305 domain-containing protein [Micromonospora zingiberis]
MAVTAVIGSGVGIALWPDSEPPYRPPSSHVVQPGAPGQAGKTLTEDEVSQLSPPKFSAADTLFIQGMIPHHEQALAMTALVSGRTDNADIALLAKRIDVSQHDEIALMQRWLEDRAVPTSGPNAGHTGHELMPGMLTAAQFDQLRQARDAEFDRLFLKFMVQHHEGALAMIKELYDAGGGLEPATDQLAREFNADQSIEIQRMQQMLAKMR